MCSLLISTTARSKSRMTRMTRAKVKRKIEKNAKQWFVPDICLCWAWLTTHQGTPIFMARSVVAGHPLTTEECACVLKGLPCLSAVALPVYSELLPERLEKFPQPPENQTEYVVMIPKEININKE